MAAVSLDLRTRIVTTDVAGRFHVSLGLVKKLLRQRRHTGDIAPRQRTDGRRGRPSPLPAGLLAGPQTPIEKMGCKLKNALRRQEARTLPERLAAIGTALAEVTAQDAAQRFAPCGSVLFNTL